MQRKLRPLARRTAPCDLNGVPDQAQERQRLPIGMALPALLLSMLAGIALAVGASRAEARPVVLLFHPGGFLLGTPQSMDPAAEVARANGLHPVEVDYPLGSPSRALRYSIEQAELWGEGGRTVYAYGASAGGSLAADLAERGLVSRSSVQAPVADIPKYFDDGGMWKWFPDSRQEAWEASPAAHPSLMPIHAWVPREDYPSLLPLTLAWIDADPLVTGTEIPGRHLEQPYSGDAMRQSFAYLTSAWVSDSTPLLTVTGAPGTADNLVISSPSASTLRLSDLASGPYGGAGVWAGEGCTPSVEGAGDCSGAITLVRATAGGHDDQVVNSTPVTSTLYGGAGEDTLQGGSANDILSGGPGADVMKGLNGDDVLRTDDLTSDAAIDCGAGTDKAYLDKLPKDPNSVVKGCETKIRS